MTGKIIPMLTPEQTEQTLREHNMLRNENAFLKTQLANQTNIAIILAQEMFRVLGYIEENRIIVQGARPGVRLKQDLVHAIPQSHIDQIETMFNGEPPAINYRDHVVNGQHHLVITLKGETDAQQAERNPLN